ncbi:MAG: maleylpyruvate isomerase N-terminal domain-containing protein [Acidimicrobiales bacterium]
MKPVEHIDTCRASHERLLADLARLPDAAFRSPSLLPGYSRGHVVTHLANKARAHVSLFEGAAAGEIRRLHPLGYDPDQAAAAGAQRSARQLLADLRTSFELLEAAWDDLVPALWERQGIMTAGPRTMSEIVSHHLRNVEVHHVDLDTGYRISEWPAVFVEGELPKRLRALPDRADHAGLLAWLVDRAPAPDLLGPW